MSGTPKYSMSCLLLSSLSVSLSLGRPSPGARSHLPTPRSRKPVLTCWPTLVETPLPLPRWHQLLLHSQPSGVSGTWEENIPTMYTPDTRHSRPWGDQVSPLNPLPPPPPVLAPVTQMNVMIILKHQGWKGWGQMRAAGLCLRV